MGQIEMYFFARLSKFMDEDLEVNCKMGKTITQHLGVEYDS
jgi:hypothetical protein